MEYTLHSVRKLMTFFHLFKDIITHKLYSRTFSDFFTGSAKYNELNWAPLVWRVNFFTKKKCQNCTLCIPLAELRKISVLLYIVQKNESSTLFFVITLSLLWLCSNNKEKNMTWNLKLYTHTHTPDPIGKLFWILFFVSST